MNSVDVIIANYNNARFLVQCLESVLAQTLRPQEIIVVDDASTDDSILVLEPYVRAGKVTLLLNNSTLGVTASRIRAIAHGSSTYFTTLDADDYYYDNTKLAAEVAIITSAQSIVVFSDVMRVDENGKEMWLVSSKRKLREGDLSFYISNLYGFIPRDYLVARADYLAVGGYNPSLRIYEDWDLKIRLAKRCVCRFSGAIGTAYRDNPKGLSRSSPREHLVTMRRIFWENCYDKHLIHRLALFARFFFFHSLYLGRFAI